MRAKAKLAFNQAFAAKSGPDSIASSVMCRSPRLTNSQAGRSKMLMISATLWALWVAITTVCLDCAGGAAGAGAAGAGAAGAGAAGAGAAGAGAAGAGSCPACSLISEFWLIQTTAVKSPSDRHQSQPTRSKPTRFQPLGQTATRLTHGFPNQAGHPAACGRRSCARRFPVSQ